MNIAIINDLTCDSGSGRENVINIPSIPESMPSIPEWNVCVECRLRAIIKKAMQPTVRANT